MYNKLFGFMAVGIFLYCFLSGCAFITYRQQLSALKGYADSQQEIKNYLKSQEESFCRLKEDAKNGLIRKGMKKQEILSLYGEPVFCQGLKEKATIEEICLYRKPTEYFSTDRLYLNFDKSQGLISWELKSGN